MEEHQNHESETKSTEPVSSHTKERRNIKIIIFVSVLIAIVCAVYLYVNSREPQSEAVSESGAKEAVIVDPVARVNGSDLSAEEYGRSLTEISESAVSFGANLADEAVQNEIKIQALDALINTELLYQAAVASGVEVTDDMIEDEYMLLETQLGGEEQFAAALESFGLTTEILRSNIMRQIAVNTYLESSIDADTLRITEEEISLFYNSVATEGDIPPLEEVRPAIEAQLSAQKEQEQVIELIDTLKTEAEIEILI